MQRSVLAFAVVVAVLASACGGDVSRDPGGAGGSSAGGSGAASGSGASAGFPSKPLGECKPGFSHYQYPTLPCPWLGDGLCYAQKDEACACVCPQDHDSWCMSDFPAEEGETALVTCE